MRLTNKRKFSGRRSAEQSDPRSPDCPDTPSSDNSEDDEYGDPLYNDETTMTMKSGDRMSFRTASSLKELESHPKSSTAFVPPPEPKRMRELANKTVKLSSSPPDDMFVTHYVDKEKHQSRFLLLPSERKASSGKEDKLSEIIKKGGGIIVGSADEEILRDEEKKHLIKILDLDFIKSSIHQVGLQSLQLPYDCFSSSFIWSQLYCKGMDKGRLSSADLNLYRITPSAYLDYNANHVLSGSLSWGDIQPVPSDKLSPAVSIKQIALQFFPESLCSIFTRKRRVYTREESQHILDAVCELNGFHKIHGVLLYKELSANFITTRSNASIREHFLKTILPHIAANDGYYRLSDENGKRFKAALQEYESRPKRGRKKRAQ